MHTFRKNGFIKVKMPLEGKNLFKLKAAVRKFCLFVNFLIDKSNPSLFENLELQLGATLSRLRGLWVSTASARMNLKFWGECVAVSHRTGVDVYCTSQSQILAYVLEYMTQIRIFTVYCHLNK